MKEIPVIYKFDIILLTEVLEHSLNPISVLMRIKRNLKKKVYYIYQLRIAQIGIIDFN